MKKIILASSSPRRKQLLHQIGLKFTVAPVNGHEQYNLKLKPHDLVRSVSKNKAASASERYSDAIIIAADTIGVIKGKIIGKPQSEAEARDILSDLAGKSHKVITGYTVVDTATGQFISHSVETKVYIKSLTKEEIDAYVATGEPLDKAGAYGIQGKGGAIVERIEGDYYNVVGLPVCALVETLKEFGIFVLTNA